MLVLPPPTTPPLRAGAAWYNSLNTVGPQIFVKLNCLRVGDNRQNYLGHSHSDRFVLNFISKKTTLKT